MSLQEVQTLELLCRLLFEVTLHESSFGWAASMQSNPEVKGPPISIAWRNAHSVLLPIHRPACLSELAPGQGLWLGSGGSGRVPKSRDLGNEVWLPWPESKGYPAVGRAGFDLPLSSTAMSQNNRQLKPQGPGLVRGKVSSRVGACCAWWWQWHWQWWGDNVAASSCVGGDSGVRREVEYRGPLLTDFLDWSVGVKGAGFTCGPAVILHFRTG